MPRRVRLCVLLTLSGACGGASLPRVSTAPESSCRGQLSALATTRELGLTQAPLGPISRIEVEGARTVPEALIREAIHQPLGQPIDADGVRDDVRRILGLSVFEDVAVYAEAEGDAAVLRYRVVERPLIARVRVDGVAEEARGASALARLAHLEGEVFVPQRLRRLRDRVATDYRRTGYGDATVQVHAQRAEGGAVDVCFEVDAGRRWRIDHFAFVGNEQIDDATLAALMANFEGRVNVVGGVYREDFLPDDILRINAAYYDRGMLDVHVSEPLVTWSESGELTVKIPIEEGPVYRLSDVHVIGSVAEQEQVYLDLFGLHAGDVFSRERAVAGFARLREYERAHGREQIEVGPFTEIDHEAHTIMLGLEFAEAGAPAPSAEPDADSTAPATEPLAEPPDVSLSLPESGLVLPPTTVEDSQP